MAAVVALQSAIQASKHQVGAATYAVHLHAPYSTDVPEKKPINLSALKRGTGGRSSFNGVVATVFGCTGFLGRYVCNKLGKIGTQLILPYRGCAYDPLRLKLVGDLGQVLFFPYHLQDEESIRKAVTYSNVVINLVGRDWETKNFKFEDVHVKGARLIARVSREMGVEKLIHVSALNAVEHPEPLVLPKGSKYFASKYRGEIAVREEFPDAVIVRPSMVYGQEDRFLRYYSHIFRIPFNMLPMWKAGKETIKQPVAAEDVAQAIVNIIREPDTAGKTYQAVGPKRYVLADLVDWFYKILRRDVWRHDMKYNPFFQLQVTLNNNICTSWPIGYLHWEGVEKEHTTDVVLDGVPTLEDLGVVLTQMENQVPWELKPYKAMNYYDEELGEFEQPIPPNPVV